jgi:hypothetical protein
MSGADEEAAYTRRELLIAGTGFPERGLLCHHCGHRIPQFKEWPESDERRVRQLIREGRQLMAISELRASAGCPLLWASLWVVHDGRAQPSEKESAPCPFCGMPLRTSLAKQCRHCRRDWHDPDKLGWLNSVKSK